MSLENIYAVIRDLTHHSLVEVVARGNVAITAALAIFPIESTVLIPAEGGWIHYKKAPLQLGLKIVEVMCDDAKINLADLREKIKVVKPVAFLYQNPGGYFAQQPMKEIYEICRKNNCLVIMDVSGSIGTKLCDGTYADILVGSFGEWKLVEAKVGGFISCKDKMIWGKVKSKLNILDDANALQKIHQQLLQLPQRIVHLQQLRTKIIGDLKTFEIVYPDDVGFVVVVKYNDENEKQQIVEYCEKHQFAYTQCPRYIRVNKKAISIEVKQNG